MIIAVTFAHSLNGGPFAGGVDTWTRLTYVEQRPESPVDCTRTQHGVTLSWVDKGTKYSGRRMTLTVPTANITQLLEVEDEPEAKKK